LYSLDEARKLKALRAELLAEYIDKPEREIDQMLAGAAQDARRRHAALLDPFAINGRVAAVRMRARQELDGIHRTS
jgi:hypothetical protein